MSAHDQIRNMLDQLMGTARNGDVNPRVRFYDPKVCKSFLLGCCPHDILASTAMEHLQSFINECDRRTELAKKRLAETQEELSAEVAAKANKVHELAELIGIKLAKAEELGAEGHVEESMQLMEEVEDIRKKKTYAEQEYRNSMPASSYQQQKLRVCEVCSAYLGIHDNDRRLADHFGGKLHLGFIKIREHLDDLKKTVEERREKRKLEREKEREKEAVERASRHHAKEKEREYHRSRSPDRRHSHSNSSHETKERSHSRSNSKSHKSRHHSHSRSHHNRSRTRSKSRERQRHSDSHVNHGRDKKRDDKSSRSISEKR